MSMSLDGFIADEQDGGNELFGWYGNGEVELPTAGGGWTLGPPTAATPNPACGGCRPPPSGRQAP